MTKWLVTGAAGMLGIDLCAALAADPGNEVTALDRAALDVTDPAAAAEAVAGQDLVINCAAWTKVDLAEEREADATAINGGGARNLAAACAARGVDGARLIQLSTDYVFPGDATAPIAEDAPTAPINAYGRSKLAGERAVLDLLPETGYVVRTAWLYGAHGKNFVATMLRVAGERETLQVVDDQVGQPTSTSALAERLLLLGQGALAGRAPAGIYHGTATGETTWYGLARATFELAGLDPTRVHAITSDKYPLPAKRPGYSVLAHDGWKRAGLEPMGDWREALVEAFSAGAF